MTITEITRDKKHLSKVTFSDGREIMLDNDVCIENSLCEDIEIEEEPTIQKKL